MKYINKEMNYKEFKDKYAHHLLGVDKGLDMEGIKSMAFQFKKYIDEDIAYTKIAYFLNVYVEQKSYYDNSKLKLLENASKCYV